MDSASDQQSAPKAHLVGMEAHRASSSAQRARERRRQGPNGNRSARAEIGGRARPAGGALFFRRSFFSCSIGPRVQHPGGFLKRQSGEAGRIAFRHEAVLAGDYLRDRRRATWPDRWTVSCGPRCRPGRPGGIRRIACSCSCCCSCSCGYRWQWKWMGAADITGTEACREDGSPSPGWRNAREPLRGPRKSSAR